MQQYQLHTLVPISKPLQGAREHLKSLPYIPNPVLPIRCHALVGLLSHQCLQFNLSHAVVLLSFPLGRRKSQAPPTSPNTKVEVRTPRQRTMVYKGIKNLHNDLQTPQL